MKRAPATLKNDDFKKAFITDSLAIDCILITLTQNDCANAKVFRAAGSMRVGPQFGVAFRLVCARDASQAPYDQMAGFSVGLGQRSGELYAPNMYYALEAMDVTGGVWKNPAVLVQIDDRPESIIVDVECQFIRMEEKCDSNSSETDMLFLEELDFPKNLPQSVKAMRRGRLQHSFIDSASRGKVAELDFFLESRAHGINLSWELYASARANEVAPANFQDRLLEAITFCTAKVLYPAMVETTHGNIRSLQLSKHRPSNKGILDEPIRPDGFDADFYRLMERYYQYACSTTTGGDVSPLTQKVGGLFTLGGVWLGTVALLIGVAVESVLDEESFAEVGNKSPEAIAAIDTLLTSMRKSGAREPELGVSTSIVGGLKATAAKGKLYALAETGAIEKLDAKTWGDVRNKRAHGKMSDDSGDFQPLLNDVYRLITLIYKLVFIRIGYKGQYVDRAQLGWPIKQFPPVLASDEPETAVLIEPLAQAAKSADT